MAVISIMLKMQNQEKKTSGKIIDSILETENKIKYSGLYGSCLAYFLWKTYQKKRRPVAAIFPDAKQAEEFHDNISFFLGGKKSYLLYFQPYNILPFKSLSYHNQTASDRIRALYGLTESENPPFLITTIEALMQMIIPKKKLVSYAELLMSQEETDRDALVSKLISGGYSRVTIVEEPGEFCVRGGIIDIFSPMYDEPLRMELFGDYVESLRFFSPATQRTTKNINEAVILPAKETILETHKVDAFISRLRTLSAECEIPVSKTRAMVERIRQEGIFPGMESFIPLVDPDCGTLFDYIPETSIFALCQPDMIKQAANDLEIQALNNFITARNKARLSMEPEKLYLGWDKTKKILKKKNPIQLKTLPVAEKAGEYYHFKIKDNSSLTMELKYSKNREKLLSPLARKIEKNRNLGFTTIITCQGEGKAEKLKFLLEPYDIKPVIIDDFSRVRPAKGLTYICLGNLSSGFIWQEESLAIITYGEIFSTKQIKKTRARKRAAAELLSLDSLKKGDLVVHSEHGIGLYGGLEKLRINGATNDFLLINYRDGDKLYLPVDKMGMIRQYMGVDGIIPPLDKMGGSSWAKVKEKVKKSVEKMAAELLDIYAQRKIKKGFSFKLDDSDYKEFEAGFPYEETHDQQKAIEDVLKDMQSPNPMDRLICGDVGYGKTEVALRASFMAVYNQTQVAVLVPTTVLAEQHFETFTKRFENFPVNIACLSRFRTKKEQKAIIENLKTGKTDIVIGTHRLVQKDVVFKRLGLMILDEEQRFGVKHKERLKKIRKTVDVLALTATPIPRTLHLSLVGIRDISIISTPPEQRRSIITYISQPDDGIITEAIQKELKRGGQIFFVHNSIKSIERMAAHINKLVPKVRLDIAHGRMEENRLEEIMVKFMEKKIDILVSTSIIESGLDVPAANTIIINRADKFGLSQIYQLRGRVGRAQDQAYAYLFVPEESSLTKDAQKRLKVLMEHSDLGSGFQIAMSDLKIRGGGTILGASQSGHIAAVGYDMFLKLMESAISDLKGEPVVESLNPEINIRLSSFISEDYIPDIDQRLLAYRKLSSMESLKEISLFKAELTDRFGKMPHETENLLLKIMLKVLSVKGGVKRLDLAENRLVLHFSPIHQKYPLGITGFIAQNPDHCRITAQGVLKVDIGAKGKMGTLIRVKNILKEITRHVNP